MEMANKANKVWHHLFGLNFPIIRDESMAKNIDSCFKFIKFFKMFDGET